MRTMKKILSIIMIAMLVATMCVIGTVSSGASGTGIGLAEWALNAYYSHWSYVYGGATPGAVDCSGLIYSYAGGHRGGDAQTFNSSYRGYLSSGIPNIHGLGLYQPGHVGVYVGGGMAVDARGDQYGVCYESVYTHGWTQYFKVPGVSYPTTGWEKFNGNSYYYENGEYLANTTRTIDGVSYTFDSTGIASGNGAVSGGSSDTSSKPSDTSSKDTDDNGPLRNGSQGKRVEKLQARLQELGYYNGLIDGDFGDLTEKAFKLFQKQAGLYVDGIAGSDVDYLYADDAPYYNAQAKSEISREDKDVLADTGANDNEDTESEDIDVTEDEDEEPQAQVYTFKLGDYDEKLIVVQERLIALGYLEEGQADGTFGNMTEAAVKEFQSANGLESTGVIDENTYQVLFSNAIAKEVKTDSDDTLSPSQNSKIEAAAAAPTTAVHTEVVARTSELSNKALANVTDSFGFKQNANATNFQFIMWLAIMIVVMLISFAIVYAVEKKKQRVPAHVGRRYQ